VVDGRPAEGGVTYRRRRECHLCKHRWTTYERVVPGKTKVRHKDGKVELFNPDIFQDRIERHCSKLDIPFLEVQDALKILVPTLMVQPEFTTERLAGYAEMLLLNLHPVAALRFALEWESPKDAADMLGIVWDFAKRTGLLIEQEEVNASR
jgi:transcriptional repressor NrdR